MSEFLTVVNPDPQSQKALVLIPDIWGLTSYNQATAQAFAADYHMPCYILDYFYQLTSTPSKFDSAIDGDKAVGLMHKMNGEDFITIFNQAIAEIRHNQPNLVEIDVVGFCFGGRLAYLAGIEKLVKKIVSFYGAGATQPGFYSNQSAVETICRARRADTQLSVLGFFGSQDDSIPESDRSHTRQLMESAQIHYEHHEFNAGHAYYQQGRPNYDAVSASASKSILDKFLS